MLVVRRSGKQMLQRRHTRLLPTRNRPRLRYRRCSPALYTASDVDKDVSYLKSSWDQAALLDMLVVRLLCEGLHQGQHL